MPKARHPETETATEYVVPSSWASASVDIAVCATFAFCVWICAGSPGVRH